MCCPEHGFLYVSPQGYLRTPQSRAISDTPNRGTISWTRKWHVKMIIPVKRHRGEPGHTRDTRTAEPHNHPNPPTHPRDRETTESVADSTAAAREPTAPRGRLGRGRPLRTQPSRLPLPSVVMALATVRRNGVSTPRRGSSDGASLTASVTAEVPAAYWWW